VWTPPPAAADVAVGLLGKAKHKRPASEHVMIVPRPYDLPLAEAIEQDL